jgi:DNA/RNA-binding domain of Phe-tRNA-synthetase-like protein
VADAGHLKHRAPHQPRQEIRRHVRLRQRSRRAVPNNPSRSHPRDRAGERTQPTRPARRVPSRTARRVREAERHRDSRSAFDAWRRAFTRFGAKPTQHRNAAEALLRRLAKRGDIPSINTLVDIGNVVSIRYAIPVAVFDLACIAGSTTVRFATGTELFTDLGSSGSIHPDPGEVIFVDSNNVVSARRWCWRQSAQSATTTTTVDALIVIEGHHDTARQDVESALADLTSLLALHQRDNQSNSYLLSPTNPALERANASRT